MLSVFKQALFVSAVAVILLLLYCIVVEVIESIKLKRDMKSKEYLKEFFTKVINTILIFFPTFMLLFGLICLAISKIIEQF